MEKCCPRHKQPLSILRHDSNFYSYASLPQLFSD